jgi:hypothetical protein
MGIVTEQVAMKKPAPASTKALDATLRVTKRTRDRLKSAAAVMGRPLYDVTNEVIENYLLGLKLPSLKTSRRVR